MVFLESFFMPLLLAHLVATGVLLGSMSHNLIGVTDYLRGRFRAKSREEWHTRIMLWAYAATYVIGALIYPAFRVHMRHEYLDARAPWATGVFEVKEHWGVLALAMLCAYYFLRKGFDPEVERPKLWLYVPFCFILNVIVWYKAVIGCILTMLRGSWP
jgi:hypothetical protein